MKSSDRTINAGRDIIGNQIFQGDINLPGYDPLKVSYSIIEVDKANLQDTIQEIATAINVKLYEEDHESIPFVPPKVFNNLEQRSKLFLHGVSASDISKIVLELISEKIEKFRKIYIINPQSLIGKELTKSSISELINKYKKDSDAIIWHNFPDDLEYVQRNIESGNIALAKVSSGSVSSLYVTLDPAYSDRYRNIKYPEIYVEEITYDRQTIHEILKSYGENVSRFKKVYSYSIERSIDEISKILWERKVTPSIISHYFNTAIENESMGYLIPFGLAREFLFQEEYYEKSLESLSDEQPQYK